MALTKVSRGLLTTSIVDNGNATAITIDSSENVGIGTSSPSAPLNISATYASDTTEQFRIEDNTGSKLDFFGYANGSKGIQAYADNGSTFYNLNLNPLGGNVGIGTSTPDTTLHLQTPNGTKSEINFAQTAVTNYRIGVPASTDALVFTYGASTERMRIDSAGNVGIGTNSPVTFGAGTAGLTVNGVSGSQISWQNNGTNVGFAYTVGNNFYTGSEQVGSSTVFISAGSERMRIDSAGNVMVGTTSQYFARFSVQGEANQNAVTVRIGTNGYPAINFQNTAGAQQGYIVTNASSVQYVSISDERAKKNIADADDAGSKIDSIQVRKFDWIADGSHQDYGMIAQELQAVAPEAVSGDADSENMMGVDYSKLVPMLVKEIQSLRTRVQTLENN